MPALGKFGLWCSLLTLANGGMTAAQSAKTPVPTIAPVLPAETPAQKDAQRFLQAATQSALGLPQTEERCQMLNAIARQQGRGGDKVGTAETLRLIEAELPKITEPAAYSTAVRDYARTLRSADVPARALPLLRQAADLAAKIPVGNRTEAWKQIAAEMADCGGYQDALKTISLTGSPTDKPLLLTHIARAQSTARQPKDAAGTFREALQAALALPVPQQRKAALETLLYTLHEIADNRFIPDILTVTADPDVQDELRWWLIPALWDKAETKNYDSVLARCRMIADGIKDADTRLQALLSIAAMHTQINETDAAKTLIKQIAGAEKAAPLIILITAMGKIDDPQTRAGTFAMLQDFLPPKNPELHPYALSFIPLVRQLAENKNIVDALAVAAIAPDFDARMECYGSLAERSADTQDKMLRAAVLAQLEAIPQDKMTREEQSEINRVLETIFELWGDNPQAMQYFEKIPLPEKRIEVLLQYGRQGGKTSIEMRQEKVRQAITLLPQITDADRRLDFRLTIMELLRVEENAAALRQIIAQNIPLVAGMKDEAKKEESLSRIAAVQYYAKDLAGALQTAAQIKDVDAQTETRTTLAHNAASAQSWETMQQIVQQSKNDTDRSALLHRLTINDERILPLDGLTHLLALATLPADRAEFQLRVGLAQLDSADRLEARKSLMAGQVLTAQVTDPVPLRSCRILLARLMHELGRTEEAKAMLRLTAEKEAQRFAALLPAPPTAETGTTEDPQAETPDGPTSVFTDIATRQSKDGDIEGAFLTLRHIPYRKTRMRTMQQIAGAYVRSRPDDHDFAWTDRAMLPEERPYVLLGIAVALTGSRTER